MFANVTLDFLSIDVPTHSLFVTANVDSDKVWQINTHTDLTSKLTSTQISCILSIPTQIKMAFNRLQAAVSQAGEVSISENTKTAIESPSPYLLCEPIVGLSDMTIE